MTLYINNFVQSITELQQVNQFYGMGTINKKYRVNEYKYIHYTFHDKLKFLMKGNNIQRVLNIKNNQEKKCFDSSLWILKSREGIIVQAT